MLFISFFVFFVMVVARKKQSRKRMRKQRKRVVKAGRGRKVAIQYHYDEYVNVTSLWTCKQALTSRSEKSAAIRLQPHGIPNGAIRIWTNYIFDSDMYWILTHRDEYAELCRRHVLADERNAEVTCRAVSARVKMADVPENMRGIFMRRAHASLTHDTSLYFSWCQQLHDALVATSSTPANGDGDEKNVLLSWPRNDSLDVFVSARNSIGALRIDTRASLESRGSLGDCLDMFVLVPIFRQLMTLDGLAAFKSSRIMSLCLYNVNIPLSCVPLFFWMLKTACPVLQHVRIHVHHRCPRATFLALQANVWQLLGHVETNRELNARPWLAPTYLWPDYQVYRDTLSQKSFRAQCFVARCTRRRQTAAKLRDAGQADVRRGARPTSPKKNPWVCRPGVERSPDRCLALVMIRAFYSMSPHAIHAIQQALLSDTRVFEQLQSYTEQMRLPVFVRRSVTRTDGQTIYYMMPTFDDRGPRLADTPQTLHEDTRTTALEPCVFTRALLRLRTFRSFVISPVRFWPQYHFARMVEAIVTRSGQPPQAHMHDVFVACRNITAPRKDQQRGNDVNVNVAVKVAAFMLQRYKRATNFALVPLSLSSSVTSARRCFYSRYHVSTAAAAASSSSSPSGSVKEYPGVLPAWAGRYVTGTSCDDMSVRELCYLLRTLLDKPSAVSSFECFCRIRTDLALPAHVIWKLFATAAKVAAK